MRPKWTAVCCFAWILTMQLPSISAPGETSTGIDVNVDKTDGQQATPTITVGPDAVLFRNGQHYRAVGVNYFDAFYRALENPTDKSYKEGFDVLAAHGIPFIRFSLTGYWPIHFQPYVADREAFYTLFDEFVASAEEHHIGLVPSVFWTAQFILPDLVGEKCNQWGNLDGETITLARDIVSGLVARYATSPTIWAWEFGNEGNLAIDLPNAADRRPPTHVSLGNPPTRDAEDDWTHEILVAALQDFGEVVRSVDSVRPITSGNSEPRPSQYHQRIALSWEQDTREQYQLSLRDLSPDPVNLISIHFYPPGEGRFGEGIRPASEMFELTTSTAKSVGKAVFVGEFGVSNDYAGGNQSSIHDLFMETLDEIRISRVSLAAVWNFDRKGFPDDPWSITDTNNRAWMLDEIQKLNETLSGGASSVEDWKH